MRAKTQAVFLWYNMYMELDLEKAEKRQALKLFITESLMVVFAIIMVVVLIMVVSGYWINENFEVSRSGMLQVSSIPSGASIKVDEDSWMQRTNASRVIPTGKHEITLSKDGYDSWSKTVDIKEGLLYRLHYPRLFPDKRKIETFPIAVESVSISKKRDIALLMNSTTKWSLLNLDDEKMGKKELDLSNIIASSAHVLTIEWSEDENRVLLHCEHDNKNEWVLIDLNDLSRSLNITNEFGVGFSDIKIINNSASELLALRDNNLQKIDLNSRSLSGVLVEKVHDFYYRNGSVVFVAEKDDGVFAQILKLGKDDRKDLVETSVSAKVLSSRFYDSDLLIILDGQNLTVYDQKDTEGTIFEGMVSFLPEKITMAKSGDFVTMSQGNVMATLDLESNTLSEWQIDDPKYGWFDDFMIYTVKDETLIVYDFDGLNRREIAKNVSNAFPVTITADKWIYYISGNGLVREWLN